MFIRKTGADMLIAAMTRSSGPEDWRAYATPVKLAFLMVDLSIA
jgi:hypothetical protein